MTLSNLLFIANEALKFYFSAHTVHDIDSPFLFTLLNQTIEKKGADDICLQIESLKKELIKSKEKFSRYDLGQGSKNNKQTKELNLGNWIQYSSINKFYGRILYRLVKHLQPNGILELGTAAGISTSYLAAGSDTARVISLEGDPAFCRIANTNFNKLTLENIKIIEGDFEQTLQSVLQQMEDLDLTFIDGNHKGNTLISQLNAIWPYLSGLKIVILDDIRWSKDMYGAWLSISKDSRWNIKLDLFRIGILIQNPDLNHNVIKKILPSRWKRWQLGLLR